MHKIKRREFLQLSGVTAAFWALSACKPANLGNPIHTPIPTLAIPEITAPVPAVQTKVTPTPTTTKDGETVEIARLVRRITFGIRQEELEHANQLGYDNFIDEQIHYLNIPDTDVDKKLESISSLQQSPEELKTLDQKAQPANDLIRATILRAVYSRRQLFELACDFWSNHFNINIRKNNVVYLKPQDDRSVIRRFALGKFGDLLSASAHSPAMLVYLDNHVSTKKEPNENYARELLELHTLGVDGGYTQADVKEVARVFTGWSVGGNKNFGQFQFKLPDHDMAEKVILEKVFPAKQGVEEGESVLQLLSRHPSTAHFIAYKLVRRFVSDFPPQTLIDQAAETYKKTDGDISAIMSTILHSAEFRSSLGTPKLKRPFEWVVSALRAVNSPTTLDKGTIAFIDAMGQPLFRWPAPDGFPDHASAWVTSNDLLNRWNFALGLAFNAMKDCPVDFSGFKNIPKNSEGLVDTISLSILGEKLPPQSRQIMNAFSASADSKIVLPGIVSLVLASPDFQYR